MQYYTRFKLLAVLLALCILFSSASFALSSDTDTEPSFVIAAATDLHVDPTNTDPGPLNALTPQNGSIIDALLWDAVSRKVDVLLLLGDVTNASHVWQHEFLIEKLHAASAKGLRIYIIPGNHDIGDIKSKDFAQLYADFGYNDSYSRDTDSLSYSVYNNGHLFLMLDTGGYSDFSAEASLSDNTVAWIRRQLQIADEKHWTVVPAGHYPILSTYTPPFPGQLELIDMLRNYNIPLYLCGHRHQRHVAMQDGLAELVVDRSTEYPCSYALIRETPDGLYYSPCNIPVSRWADANGVIEPSLTKFESFMDEQLHERSKKTIETLLKGREFDPEYIQAAEDFIYRLNAGYSDGTINTNMQRLYDHPGYEPFLTIAEGTIYYTWVPQAIRDAVPYTEGFVLRDGKMELPE